MKSIAPFCIVLLLSLTATAEDYKLHTFTKHKKTATFHGEGASYGDFNKDGHMDVVSGPYIYYGPDFSNKGSKFAYREVKEFKPTGYSDNFLTHVHDFNGDGYDDILIIGWPGYKKDHEHVWYENPGSEANATPRLGPIIAPSWKRHLAFKTVDNESPMLGDFIGNDGKPELVFHTGGKLGWAAPDPKNPTAEWKFHPLSPKGKWQRYTHGIGFGDVNGDGRNDFLEVDGWWEQPESLEGDPVWKRHIWRFGDGGAQMFAYDVDGDGDNDIITSIRAHGFGLAWFEHYKDDGKIKFKQHRFMDSKPEHNKYGVKFSQLHALDLIDMDKDGVKDIVTGKRFWAHGPKGDAEPNAPAVLYWFKIKRLAKGGGDKTTDGSSVDFIPYQIDNDSGVGTQVTAGDITGNGYPDVIVGNKKGTFIFVHEVKKVDKTTWQKAQPKVRTGE